MSFRKETIPKNCLWTSRALLPLQNFLGDRGGRTGPSPLPPRDWNWSYLVRYRELPWPGQEWAMNERKCCLVNLGKRKVSLTQLSGIQAVHVHPPRVFPSILCRKISKRPKYYELGYEMKCPQKNSPKSEMYTRLVKSPIGYLQTFQWSESVFVKKSLKNKNSWWRESPLHLEDVIRTLKCRSTFYVDYVLDSWLIFTNLANL